LTPCITASDGDEVFRTVEQLGDIPVAICAPSPLAGQHPLVLVWHGLGGEKEDLLEALEHLAGQGFAAIGVDAVGHGARRSAELEERLFGKPDEQARAFLDVVQASSAEVPALINAVDAEGWRGTQPLALLGTSLGGFITLAAPRDERIAARLSISGSPRFDDGRPGSPEERLDACWPCAILLLHGADDDVVPAGPGLAFIEGLRPLYLDDPDRLRRVVLPGEGHLFSAAGEALVREEVDGWLGRWLLSDTHPSP
jgi:dienelactone hydrolase